jgi:hypothetical protein
MTSTNDIRRGFLEFFEKEGHARAFGTALGLGIIAKVIIAGAIIGAGLVVASNVLLGPSMLKISSSLADGGGDRLYVNLDPTTRRKFVFAGTREMVCDWRR